MKEKTNLSPIEIECVRDIYREIKLQNRKSGNIDLRICLGEFELAEEKMRFLKNLQASEVIKELSIPESELIEDDFPTKNEDESETLQIYYVQFKVNLSKLKVYATSRSLWPVFYIRMHPNSQKITINNEYTLRTPQEGHWTQHFWKYVISNPRKHIPGQVLLNHLKKMIGDDFTFGEKSIRHMLDNYKLTGAIQKLFFPVASKTGVRFINPVLQRDIDKSGFSEKQIDLSLKKISDRSKS